MESIVEGLKKKEQIKSRIFSRIASMTILLIFCYLVANFFTSGDHPPDNSNPADTSWVRPKFLHPLGQP